MPTFLNDDTYNRLMHDLSGAIIKAATSAQLDLHDALVLALADADILPEVCRCDFEDVERVAA